MRARIINVPIGKWEKTPHFQAKILVGLSKQYRYCRDNDQKS